MLHRLHFFLAVDTRWHWSQSNDQVEQIDHLQVKLDYLCSNRYKHTRTPPDERKLSGPAACYDMAVNEKFRKLSELKWITNSMLNPRLTQDSSIWIVLIQTCSSKKNRNSRLLGHVNFDSQNHRFFRNGNKNGFISGFGHYFPDFGYYLGFASK